MLMCNMTLALGSVVFVFNLPLLHTALVDSLRRRAPARRLRARFAQQARRAFARARNLLNSLAPLNLSEALDGE